MTKIIITFNENSNVELFLNNINILERIKDGILLCENKQLSYEELSNYIKNNNLFVRHIQPAEIVNNNFDFSNLLDKNKTYSIQIRNRNIELYNKIKGYLNNFKEDVKNPEQVISITEHKGILYGGVSETKYNLSRWLGGECRYNVKDLISRAELKLIEAIEVFNIDIKKYKTAIDLGCAPGGWSKVLLDNNIKVIGIDPANIDSRVLNNKNFTHFKDKVENFKNKEAFDLIVNDMKMDFKKSIDITKKLLKNLNSNSVIIMTIKLYKKDDIIESLKYLKNNFTILQKRQLYHNRNEYTVLIKINN